MAVEWVDTTRSRPGIEGDIIGLTRIAGKRIFLDWLCQHMSIFSHNVEEVTVQVHRMHHHRISAYKSDVNGLPMFDIDWLSIGKALAIEDIVAVHGTNELRILYIGMNGLMSLGRTRAWVHDDSSVEATGNLLNIII